VRLGPCPGNSMYRSCSAVISELREKIKGKRKKKKKIIYLLGSHFFDSVRDVPEFSKSQKTLTFENLIFFFGAVARKRLVVAGKRLVTFDF